MERIEASWAPDPAPSLPPEPPLQRLLRSARPAPSLAQAARADLLGTLRRELDGASAGFPDLQAMAARLHLSARTLKRRLRHEGTSYRGLLSEIRHRRCLQLLRDTHLGLESIAEQLGYASSANFNRAFKRWAGVTPGQRRLQLRGEPGSGLAAQLFPARCRQAPGDMPVHLRKALEKPEGLM